jgi:hypothetical protein
MSFLAPLVALHARFQGPCGTAGATTRAFACRARVLRGAWRTDARRTALHCTVLICCSTAQFIISCSSTHYYKFDVCNTNQCCGALMFANDTLFTSGPDHAQVVQPAQPPGERGPAVRLKNVWLALDFGLLPLLILNIAAGVTCQRNHCSRQLRTTINLLACMPHKHLRCLTPYNASLICGPPLSPHYHCDLCCMRGRTSPTSDLGCQACFWSSLMRKVHRPVPTPEFPC